MRRGSPDGLRYDRPRRYLLRRAARGGPSADRCLRQSQPHGSLAFVQSSTAAGEHRADRAVQGSLPTLIYLNVTGKPVTTVISKKGGRGVRLLECALGPRPEARGPALRRAISSSCDGETTPPLPIRSRTAASSPAPAPESQSNRRGCRRPRGRMWNRRNHRVLWL